jgi:iron complex outermembrane receptor protein
MQAFAATPAPTASGTELEEVIVTAERRTVDIQNVAASVSVRTGDELAVQGRYTTRQILEDVPGVVAVDNNSVNLGGSDVQGNNITIRGITPGPSASTSPNGISGAPGVAVYTDGVYEGIGNAYDIDRVEVLRGPQGTLYGRSATAGVVAFHTRNPSLDAFGGNAGVEIGNYDLQHYTAAVNIPLGHGFAARVAADYRNQGNGYYDQAAAIAKTQNGRVKLLWSPNDDFSLLLGFADEVNDNYSGGNNKLPVASIPTLAITSSNGPLLPGRKQQRQFWAEANWNVGPATITYLPAYRTWEQRDNNLVDNNFLGEGVALKQLFLTPQDTFMTHELRVASKDGSAIQWLAGAFYYHNVLHNSNHNALTSPSGVEVAVLSDTVDQKDTLDKGLFAEATFPLMTSLRMTLGARYDDTRVIVGEYFFNDPYSACGNTIGIPYPPPGSTFTCTGPATASVPPPPGASTPPGGVELNFHNFNYKARFEYDLTPKNMLYGMLSTGFRPGDAGVRANGVGYLLNTVDSEKLTAIEAGSKNRFLDDSLQLNVGVYYYNYHGFRTSYIPDTPNPLDPAVNFQSTVALTVPAHNYGAELELQYRLTAHDRFGFNYNYVESRWYDKPVAFAQAQSETKRAMTPYSMNADYEHVFTLPGGSTLSGRIDGRFQAGHLNQNLHSDWLRLGYEQYVYVGSRTTGNLTGTWASEGGRWTISAYVRNFTNKTYTTYAVAGSPVNLNVTYSDPRTYGAQAAVRF